MSNPCASTQRLYELAFFRVRLRHLTQSILPTRQVTQAGAEFETGYSRAKMNRVYLFL